MKLNLEQRVDKLEKIVCLCCPHDTVVDDDTAGNPFVLYTQNTVSVTLSGNGTLTSKLQAVVNRSPQPNNILVELSDGMYVGAPDNSSPLARNGANIDTGWIEWGGLLVHNTVIDQDSTNHYNINFKNGKLGFGMSTTPTHTISVGNETDGSETVWIYALDGTTAIVAKSGAINAGGLALLGKSNVQIHPNYGSGGNIIIDDDGNGNQYVSISFLSGGQSIIGKIGLDLLEAGVSNEFYFKALDIGSGPTLRTGFITLYDKIKLINIPNDDATTKLITIDANNNVRYKNYSAGSTSRFGLSGEDISSAANRAFDNGAHTFAITNVTTLTLSATAWVMSATTANLQIAGYSVANNGDVLTLLDKTTGSVGWTTPTGSGSGIIGSTGAVDNAIIRANGTGGATIQASAPLVDDSGNITPGTNDGGALGTTSLKWSDLFLANGAIINFNAGNYVITHSAGLLSFSGGLAVGTTLSVSGLVNFGILSANKIVITDGSKNLVSSLSIADLNMFTVTPITANYTLAASDFEMALRYVTAASVITITVPTNASVPIAIGKQTVIAWDGVGQPAFAAAAGVTIRSEAGALKIAARYGFATLIKKGTDEWWLSGNITV